MSNARNKLKTYLESAHSEFTVNILNASARAIAGKLKKIIIAPELQKFIDETSRLIEIIFMKNGDIDGAKEMLYSLEQEYIDGDSIHLDAILRHAREFFEELQVEEILRAEEEEQTTLLTVAPQPGEDTSKVLQMLTRLTENFQKLDSSVKTDIQGMQASIANLSHATQDTSVIDHLASTVDQFKASVTTEIQDMKSSIAKFPKPRLSDKAIAEANKHEDEVLETLSSLKQTKVKHQLKSKVTVVEVSEEDPHSDDPSDEDTESEQSGPSALDTFHSSHKSNSSVDETLKDACVVQIQMKDGESTTTTFPMLLPLDKSDRPANTIMDAKFYKQLKMIQKLPNPKRGLPSKTLFEQYEVDGWAMDAIQFEICDNQVAFGPIALVRDRLLIPSRSSKQVPICGVLGQNVFKHIDLQMKEMCNKGNMKKNDKRKCDKWFKHTAMMKRRDGAALDLTGFRYDFTGINRSLESFLSNKCSEDSALDGMGIPQDDKPKRQPENPTPSRTHLSRKEEHNINPNASKPHKSSKNTSQHQRLSDLSDSDFNLTESETESIHSASSKASVKSNNSATSCKSSKLKSKYDKAKQALDEYRRLKKKIEADKLENRDRKFERQLEDLPSDTRTNDWDRKAKRSRSPPNRKIPSLEPFHGLAKENFHAFRWQYERISKEQRWDISDSLNLNMLYDYLRGNALIFATNVGSDRYSFVIKKLEKMYGNRVHPDLAQMQLRKLHQSEDQTLAEFYNEIVDKAREAYPSQNIIDATIQSDLVNVFLYGLRNEKAAFDVVKGNRRPSTLFKAYTRVLEYEELRSAVINSKNRKKNIPVRKAQAEPEILSDSENSSSMDEEEISTQWTKAKPLTDKERFQKRAAFLAEKAAEALPTKKKTEKADKGQCFFCHDPSHVFRNCSLRLKEEEERIKKMLDISRKQVEESTLQLPNKENKNPQSKPSSIQPSSKKATIKAATVQENEEIYISDDEKLSE